MIATFSSKTSFRRVVFRFPAPGTSRSWPVWPKREGSTSHPWTTSRIIFSSLDDGCFRRRASRSLQIGKPRRSAEKHFWGIGTQSFDDSLMQELTYDQRRHVQEFPPPGKQIKKKDQIMKVFVSLDNLDLISQGVYNRPRFYMFCHRLYSPYMSVWLILVLAWTWSPWPWSNVILTEAFVVSSLGEVHESATAGAWHHHGDLGNQGADRIGTDRYNCGKKLLPGWMGTTRTAGELCKTLFVGVISIETIDLNLNIFKYI